MKNKFLNILKNTFGIEWFFLLLPIACIDPSAAMLCLMFAGPIAVIALILMNFLRNKFKNRFIITKIFFVLRTVSVLLILIFAILITKYGVQLNSPQERFKSFIMDPIPASVANLKRSGSVYAMGSSSLYLIFDISPVDFDIILHSQKFSKFYENDVNNIRGRTPKLYEFSLNDAKKIIGDASKMYVYEYQNSSYRYEILIVNKEHNKVYFGVR